MRSRMRRFEISLIKHLSNPRIKNPRTGLWIALVLSLGCALSPWIYNFPFLAAGLIYYLPRKDVPETYNRQEYYACALFVSALVDIILELVWVPFIFAPETSLWRINALFFFLLVLLFKITAARSTLWRLRDKGYEFRSLLMDWEARKMYGNYDGGDIDLFLPISSSEVLDDDNVVSVAGPAVTKMNVKQPETV